MNLHLPRTQEARAEAAMLMSTINNLATPKNGEVLISATQDFLTCAYLLTSKDTFFTRQEFCNLCCFMVDARLEFDLPTPAILKPKALYTGVHLICI